ncbi:hypothetical protein [Burkholderia sp. Tr-20390]|uniref:hypothetical protein n=1 Tax=Burkholderia sp. Tr-20390 TaxID=2703904 RepID=UPI00197CD431|nr:hypothetical protein [Burkholderia sp. Tr-20390]MBN3729495.1 hypothetical protein [Burkholderia sp. Tr-20390]
MRGNDDALKLCHEHYLVARNTSGLFSVLDASKAKKERNAAELAQRIALKVECPACGKRVTPAGLKMHAQASHADAEVDVAGVLRAFEERAALTLADEPAENVPAVIVDANPEP